MIKNKKEKRCIVQLAQAAEKLKRNKGITAAVTISFLLLSGLTYLSFYENAGFAKRDISDFEVGKVAERDIISNKTLEYIDEKATEIRKNAALHSVTAVFDKDVTETLQYKKEYFAFSDFITEKKNETKKVNEFKFAVLEKYPTALEEKTLEKLFNTESFETIVETADAAFKRVYEAGVSDISLSQQAYAVGSEDAAFAGNGAERDQPLGRTVLEKDGAQSDEVFFEADSLNDSAVTVVERHNGTQSYKTVALEKIVAYKNVEKHIKDFLASIKKTEIEKEVLSLLLPFIKPDVLYNSKETEKRAAEALSQVKPVIITINKNQRIVRRGFVINEQMYNKVKAYFKKEPYVDIRYLLSSVTFLALVIAGSMFLLSKNILGSSLGFSFIFLIVLFFDFIYILLLFMSKLSVFHMPFNMVPILPVAFFVMLIAALISQKVAACTIFILASAVFGATDYKITPALFSVFSALAATSLIRISGKRMDLIKTACLLTLVQPVIALSFAAVFYDLTDDLTAVVLGTALNGFISGIFVLGFLPILESILNTPTSFRLIELSDLNTPIMKKMLITVPGTYNHSMMVASLAESACGEIGANSLLARVGAYYHDIGKMEQGEYFVENQRSYNKHLDLNPRLSATILRSHLKLGIEKARQLRLPQQVIDIISEHHGNSIIAYFYAKAKEENPDVDPEDFSYPGTPPRSKESAVVMLADTVEAACRTLERPSVPRLQKFIDELVAKKIESGMLDNADITFRDITVIKESFVKILAGYYHSRIEYPNQNKADEAEKDDKKNLRNAAAVSIGETLKESGNV